MVEPLSFPPSPRDSAAVRLALRLRARGIGVSGRVTERELYDALAFFLREELARTQAPVGGDCALVGEGFALRLPLLRMAGRLGLGEALDGMLQPYGYTLHSLSANQEGPPPAPEGNVLGELADSVLSAGLSAQVFSLYRNPVTDRLSPWLTPHPEEGAAVSFGGQVEEHFRGGAPMEVRVQGAREVTAVPLRGQMAGPAGCGTAQLFLFRCGRNTPDPCGSSSDGG